MIKPVSIETCCSELVEAIRANRLEAMHAEILALHPADLGDVLEGLSRDDRTARKPLATSCRPELLIEVEGVVLEDVLEHLDDHVISENLDELDSNDA